MKSFALILDTNDFVKKEDKKTIILKAMSTTIAPQRERQKPNAETYNLERSPSSTFQDSENNIGQTSHKGHWLFFESETPYT